MRDYDFIQELAEDLTKLNKSTRLMAFTVYMEDFYKHFTYLAKDLKIGREVMLENLKMGSAIVKREGLERLVHEMKGFGFFSNTVTADDFRNGLAGDTVTLIRFPSYYLLSLAAKAERAQPKDAMYWYDGNFHLITKRKKVKKKTQKAKCKGKKSKK